MKFLATSLHVPRHSLIGLLFSIPLNYRRFYYLQFGGLWKGGGKNNPCNSLV